MWIVLREVIGIVLGNKTLAQVAVLVNAMFAGLRLGEGDLEQLGMIWEHLDKAGPRSINGLPCFFSMRLLHVDQLEELCERGRRIAAAIKGAM